jgi:hypothetical protein
MMISRSTAVPRQQAMKLRGEVKVPWNSVVGALMRELKISRNNAMELDGASFRRVL